MTEEEFLSGYDPSKYPIVTVTTDIVAITLVNGKLSVLLVERKGHPFQNMWALPGGFIDPTDETLDDCALRELMEETSTTGWLEQLKTYGDARRDPRGRVVSIAYLSILPSPTLPQAGSDASNARWWAIEDLAVEGEGMPLAFDHAKIIADGVERVRAKLEYTTIGTSFLSQPFTIADLRRVYEAVWGMELNQGNFWSKVKKVDGFVVPTGEKAKPSGKGAPGDLYFAGELTEELFPPIRRTAL